MSTRGLLTHSVTPDAIQPRHALLIAALASLAVAFFYASAVSAVVFFSVLIFVGAYYRVPAILYFSILTVPLAPIIELEGFAVHDLFTFSRFVLFAGILLRKWGEGSSLREWLWRGRLEKWQLAFFLIATLSGAVLHPLEGGAARSLVRLLSYLLFFYSITGWVNTKAQLRSCLLWLFISTIAVCALAFHQIASVSLTDWFNWLYWNQMDVAPPWQGRPTSVFLGVNSLAAHVNMVIPFALAVQVAPEEKYEFRFAAKLCLILSLIVLVLTLSRGAFLAFAMTIPIYLRTILRDSRIRWKWISGIAITLLIGVLISYVAIATLPGSEGVSTSERFSGGDEVTFTRLLIYAAAFEMFLGSPLFGIGYGNFRGHFDATAQFGSDLTWDAHSLYFKYLAEVGLVGLLCFLGLMWCAFRIGRKMWQAGNAHLERALGIAVIAAITTVLVQGSVESLIENPPFGSMLWFILAVGVLSSRLKGQPEIGGHGPLKV